jgi:uncharacterized membrane protein
MAALFGFLSTNKLSSPADPSIFVEKRMGIGWTLNFGNPWAWGFAAAAIGIPLAIVLLAR